MEDWDAQYDESSEFDEMSSTSDTSSSFVQSELSVQPGARETAAASHSFDDQSSHSAIHTSGRSSKSIRSDEASHTPCDGSVCSFPPHRSAPGQLTDASASTSLLSDPILERFASRTPPATPIVSPIGQIALSGSTSSSAGSTESAETDSQSTPSSAATSEASQEEDLIFTIDPDHDDHTAGAADQGSSLLGLELPEEYLEKPRFCDANDDTAIDICEVFREVTTYLQAGVDGGPWAAAAADGRARNPDESVLALVPSPAYNEYHSHLRKYTRGYRKVGRYRPVAKDHKAQQTNIGFCDEPTKSSRWQREISPYALAQCSSTYIGPQGRRSRKHHEWDGERASYTGHQLHVNSQFDSDQYSVEPFVSSFHPYFLVAHLSRSSISSLATQFYSSEDLCYDIEHDLRFDLGFGPPIELKVCTFTPKDTKDLRTYQKDEGKDILNVQESLPIIVNEFTLEPQAGELDTWLDEFIDSTSGLTEYADLMMLRQENHPNSQLLNVLMSWYVVSEYKLSDAQKVLRTALKLLMTTTLLSLVPKVTNLPTSLSDLLSPQSSAQSGVAPRLVTRQIKASLYRLQQEYLKYLYFSFTNASNFPTDIKIAVAFLMAYVLDLVRNAGRDFVKYLRDFNANLVVTDQAVTEYEVVMQTQLFGRVQASVGDAIGRKSDLANRWRNTGSILKGKERESDEYRFVASVLDTVL